MPRVYLFIASQYLRPSSRKPNSRILIIKKIQVGTTYATLSPLKDDLLTQVDTSSFYFRLFLMGRVVQARKWNLESG